MADREEPPILADPGSQLPQRKLSLGLLDQKISRFKILETSSEECGPIVFHCVVNGRPGGNPDLRFVPGRLYAEQNISFVYIFAEPEVAMFNITNQQFASFQSLN